MVARHHQPTPPAYTPPAYGGWALLQPFTMASPSQFRAEPGALFDLGGEAYTIDYAEVKDIGDARVYGGVHFREDCARRGARRGCRAAGAAVSAAAAYAA